jgi:hypothetical protein
MYNEATRTYQITRQQIEREFQRQGTASGFVTRIVTDTVARCFPARARKGQINTWDIVVDGWCFAYWQKAEVIERIFRDSTVVAVSPKSADIQTSFIRK